MLVQFHRARQSAKRLRQMRRRNSSRRRDSPFLRSQLGLELLENRNLLASVWQNPLHALDVLDDGAIVPLDAMLIINELNAKGARRLPLGIGATAPYLDTNGDGSVDPLDAQLVIIELNSGVAWRNFEFELANDTGRFDDDRVTLDAGVAGRIFEPLLANQTAQIRYDRGDVHTVAVQADGSFALDASAPVNVVDGNVRISMAFDSASGGRVLRQFGVVLDRTAPNSLQLLLTSATDSGASDTDLITNVDTPVVAVTTEANAQIEVFVDGTSIDSEVAASGQATFAAMTLGEGVHLVQAIVADVAGNVASASIDVTIDLTAPPPPEVRLSAVSDSGIAGDGVTNVKQVTIVGTTVANSLVTIANTSLAGLASNSGQYQLPGVLLSEGANTFSIQVADLAGNVGSRDVSYTLEAAQGSVDPVLEWNLIALEMIRQDATTPPVATRALAMVHIALLDALAALDGTPSFLIKLAAPVGASPEAAVVAAAHRVLTYVFPRHQSQLDAALASSLARVAAGPPKTNGVAFGQQVADAVITIRARDGWDEFVEHSGGSAPGQWQTTGPMYDEGLLPQWADLTPFAMTTPEQFRPDGPPDLASAEYATALNEVKSLGQSTGSSRTAEQTEIARFWSDGLATYTPPGHWNQIAAQIATQDEIGMVASARLFAILNVALADAAIATWDAKYHYDLWRPITAIQQADRDGNASTQVDESWTPLLISPPFPEYISGHSTFSGAAAEVLTSVLGENVAFTTTSLGLPGVARQYSSFAEAAAEAGRSRIYGGIHFEFANHDGQATGRAVANQVLDLFRVTTDVLAPRVILDSPEANAVAADNVTVSGRVFDNLSGVALLETQINGGPWESLAFDAHGQFVLATAFATDGSADQVHTIRVQATDFVGNRSTALVQDFTLDTNAPAISLTSPLDGSDVNAGTVVSGAASGTGSSIVALNYRINGGQPVPIPFDSVSGNFVAPLDLSRVAPGVIAWSIQALDAAGNTTTLSGTSNLPQRVPLLVSAFQPAHGATEVGSTYRPQVSFSRPINNASLSSANFYATSPLGTKLPATIVPAQDGSFAWLFFATPQPGAARITIHVVGDTIQSADGSLLDADGDGTPGGHLQFSYTTVSLAPLAGTSLSGIVVDPGPDLKPMTQDDLLSGPDGILHTPDDDFLLPIANAKVFIVGREGEAVFTDAQGRFVFDSVPAGNVKLAVDGRTATGVPAAVYFPEMVMDLAIEVGRANTVMGTMGTTAEKTANLTRPEVYLPRIRQSILQAVSTTQSTTIGVDAQSAPELTPERRSQLTLEVQPGSAIGENGLPLAGAQVGISTVPPELVREMLPPGVLRHTFDITIQAPGAATFATPVELTIPNVFNAPPGSQLNLLSFDHTTGRLVIEGTMTVSADGKSATTDPGQGVTHPGWHGGTPRGTSASVCTLPATPTVIVDPVPDINIPTGDLFFKDDLGAFTLSFENDASKISLNPFSNACNATNKQATPMVVELTVNHPPQNLQFTSPNFVTQTITLLPQQSKEIEVEMTDLFPFIKQFEQDVLFGANVEINVYRSDNPGTSLFQDTFNVYRYLDAADDKHDDGVLEFSDTVADGPANVVRSRPVELRVHPAAEVTASLDVGLADFSVSMTNGRYDLAFDPVGPSGLGQQSRTLEFRNRVTDELSGILLLQGNGIAKTQLYVNKPKLIAELAKLAGPNDRYQLKVEYLNVTHPTSTSYDDTMALQFDLNIAVVPVSASAEQVVAAIEALPPIPPGSVAVERFSRPYTTVEGLPAESVIFNIEFLGPLNQTPHALTAQYAYLNTTTDYTVTRSVDDSLISANERKLFDNLEDDGVTPKPSERSDLADAVEQALFTLFTGFHDGVELTSALPSGSGPSVSYLWGAAPGLSFGESGAPVAPNGNGVDNFNNQTAIVQNASKHSTTLNTFLLARDTNKLPTTDVLVFPGSHLEWMLDGKGDLSRNDFINSLAYTAAHEGGHTLGLNHTAQGANSAGFSIIATNDVGQRLEIKNPALADCNVAGCRDIMYGGNLDFVGDNKFQPGLAAELLKIGLKTTWTPGEGQAALSFLAAQRALSRITGFAGFNAIGELDHALGDPILGPKLALFDAAGLLVFDRLDFGEVLLNAEQPGRLSLVNLGADPVVLQSLSLADETNSYTLSGFTPGASLASGERLTLDLTFTPANSGASHARLLMKTSDPDAPAEIALRGFGVSPVGDVRLELPNNNVGGVVVAGGPRSFTDFAVLKNIGAADLTITEINMSAASRGQFSLTGLPDNLGPQNPLILASGASYAFNLVFDPNETGLIPGEIIIATSDPETLTLRQPVVGTGINGGDGYRTLGNDYVAMLQPGRSDAQVLRAISDDAGNFSFFVPAEQLLQTIVFDPTAGLVAHSFDKSALSGQDTLLPAMRFVASTAPDNDGDGLPGDIELAIGTSDDNVDTNGDGVSDFAALRAGIDPLSGFSAATGQVGVATFDHFAVDVTIASDPRQPDRPLAFVATGDLAGGLAIADVADPTRPVVLSQLALPGLATHVAVDSARNLAVVSAGDLHVVNISNPTAPQLIRTIGGGGGALELYDGVAYVARDTFLAAIDLETGATLDTLPRGFGGRFTDMVRVGAMLYVMNEVDSPLELHVLRIIEIVDSRQGQMMERGAVTVQGSAGGLFVDGGIAYATLPTGGGAGGYATVDVSNPDHPVLITGEEAQTGLPRTAIATDGTGRGFLVGREAPAPFNYELVVLDVTNPVDTGAVTTIFTLPEEPRAIAYGAGKAFVVTGRPISGGTAGALRVYNFPAFDNQGQPPNVTLVSPVDVDAGREGLQIIEGVTRVHVATVSDDVQIRRVELLANGQVVASDFGAPFEFAFQTPAADPLTTFVLAARAIDTGGNVGLSQPISLEVVPENVPPQIILLDPIDGGFRREGAVNVAVRFNEQLAAASFAAGNFIVRDSLGAIAIPTAITIDADARGITLHFAALAAGDYDLAINGQQVTDLAGNPFASGLSMTSFHVLSSAVFWVNPAGGDWNTPGNWSNNQIPGPEDDVVIGVDGQVTITASNVSARSLRSEETITVSGDLSLTVASQLLGGLNLLFGADNSTLIMGDDVILAGDSSLDGAIAGAGALTNFGRINLPDGALAALNTTLHNYGTFEHDGATLELRGVFNNQAGGTYELRGGALVDGISGGVFHNFGEILKSGALSTATIAAVFNSTSQPLRVPYGELRLTGGGTWTDTLIEIAQGAKLSLGDGDFVYSGNTTVSGNGVLSAQRGTLTIPAGSATTVNLAGDTLELGTTGGGNAFDLIVDGTLTNLGHAIWQNIDILVGPAPAAFINEGLLEIKSNVGRRLEGQFTNRGSVQHSDAGILTLSGATIDNQASAVWEFRGRAVLDDQAVTSSVFNNAGALRRTNDAGVLTLDVPLHHMSGATVDVQIGTLLVTRGGELADTTATVASGATLRFSGGDYHVLADSTFNGDGLIELTSGNLIVDAGAHLDLNLATGGFNIAPTGGTDAYAVLGTATNNGLVTLSRGRLNAAGTLTSSGTLRWINGTIVGDGLVNTGLLELFSNTSFNGILSGTLTNRGMLNHLSTRNLTFTNGALINETGGVYDLQSIGGFALGFSSATHLFHNSGGELRKSGAGATTLATDFVNAGTVNLQTGTTTFSRGYTQTAGTTNLIGGDLSVNTLTVALQGGSLVGSGTITGNVSNGGVITVGGGGQAGTLTITRNYTQSASGELNLELGGTALGQFDRLLVNTAAGTQFTSLAGSLNIALLDSYSPVASDEFSILTFEGVPGDFTTKDGLDLSGGIVLQPRFDPGAFVLVATQPLRAAAIGASPVDAAKLSLQAAAGLLDGLLQWLVASGLSASAASRIGDVQLEIASLSDDRLALAGGGAIYIDDDAAGHNWFVDDTPFAHDEFFESADDGLLASVPNPKATGNMDLLTVLAHELAHLLGAEHDDRAGLLSPTLAAGTRQILSAQAINELFGDA